MERVDIMRKDMGYFTVGTLIKALQQCNPDTPVWLVGMHARPAMGLEVTTTGDPVTGKESGHPDNPRVVIIR
jgi:hypothetical protein